MAAYLIKLKLISYLMLNFNTADHKLISIDQVLRAEAVDITNWY